MMETRTASLLAGKRVLITRPRAQAEGFVERLAELGAVPVIFPTIEIAPLEDTSRLDRAIAELGVYRWVIFTSVNGVAAFWQRLIDLGKDKTSLNSPRIAAIGPATARALREKGIQPDFVPQEYVAEAIAPGLGEVRGQRILLLRAEIARKALVTELEKRGAIPEEIAVYRTLPTRPDAQAMAGLEKGVDIATFTSSSTVRYFFEILGERAQAVLAGAAIACIGPITAETAQEYGLTVDITAGEYTVDGLIQALIRYVTQDKKES
jgi:uroporphyrinogen III methyltransferase / synthase